MSEEKRLQDKLREFGCKHAAATGKGSTATKLEGFGLVVKGRRLIVRRVESRDDVAGKYRAILFWCCLIFSEAATFLVHTI